MPTPNAWWLCVVGICERAAILTAGLPNCIDVVYCAEFSRHRGCRYRLLTAAIHDDAMHYPDFETFAQLAAGVHLVPVYRRLVSDSLTPVSAFHKIDAGASACLFESVVGGEKVGRYSFLAAEPFQEIEARGNRVIVAADRSATSEDVRQPTDPLEELRQRVEAIARGPPARVAAVRQRRGRLRRLRRRPLRRAPAQRARTTIADCPTWRSPSTTNGRVRQRHQDDRRRGDGPARSAAI